MDAVTKSGGVTAVVEYDYTAKEPDELDLIKGAVIQNIKQMPGGWWEGTLQSNGKTGMFPDNFVRVIDLNDDNTVILRDKSAANNRRCKVIYSYVQVNDDELSLAVGDVIEFLGEVEEGWWRGRLKNKIGVFPSNFVKVIEPSPVFASKRPPLTVTNAPNAPNAVQDSIVNNNKMKSKISSSSSSSSSSAAASTNRLSFHNSKEDLLNSTTLITTSTTTITTTMTSAAIGTTTMTSASTILNNNSSNSLGNMLLTSATVTAIGAGAGTGAVDDAAPILPPKPQREHCRVEFPYTPQNDDELELKVGDIIIIHSTELPDRGWWKGELRGKIGVFPDNFVKLIPASDVSPLNDNTHHHNHHQHPAHPQQTHRTAKTSLNNHHTTASTNATNHLNSVVATAKSIIKKSGSSSSTQSSHRKDSFGSRDSLNDILSETGLTSGNVAAQRKSLESKNFDLSNAATDAATRIALKKQQQQQQQQQQQHILMHQHEMKGYQANGTVITTNSSNSNNIMASSELRKSNENVDEKNKTTPPPVLTKKPLIPNKKGNTVSSVAGNIFSGLKQKVKSVESKLTTAASHDAADGLHSSKMSPNNIVAGSNLESNNVAIRRAATIAVEDTEFDRIERTSILTDMRAGRVKAPKRRLPSNSTSIVGESNNNSLYVNGTSGGSGGSGGGGCGSGSDDQLKSDDNSTSDELLAKPKPREWEKKKAPWMEELKASQVKKKTSPSVDNHIIGTTTATSLTTSTSTSVSTMTTTSTTAATFTTSGNNATVERTSKLFNDDGKMINSSINSHTSVTGMSGNGSNSNSVKPYNDSMSKSLSAKFNNETNIGIANGNDDSRARPNSLSLRNRSLSPSLAMQLNKPQQQQQHNEKLNSSYSPAAPAVDNISNSKVSSTSSNHYNQQQNPTHHHQSHQYQHQHQTPQYNHHHQQQQQQQQQHNFDYECNIMQKSDNLRLNELESRVDKLEMLVNTQQRTIDELVRALREETDRVKLLRSELDKYAQCVTQV